MRLSLLLALGAFFLELQLKEFLLLFCDCLVLLPSLARRIQCLLSILGCRLEVSNTLSQRGIILLRMRLQLLDVLRVFPLEGVEGALGVSQSLFELSSLAGAICFGIFEASGLLLSAGL